MFSAEKLAIAKTNGISLSHTLALAPSFPPQRIECENGLRATFKRIVIYFRRHNEPPRAQVDVQKRICVTISQESFVFVQRKLLSELQ